MNTNIKIDFEMNKKKKDWLGSFYMETRSRQRPTNNFLAYFFFSLFLPLLWMGTSLRAVLTVLGITVLFTDAQPQKIKQNQNKRSRTSKTSKNVPGKSHTHHMYILSILFLQPDGAHCILSITANESREASNITTSFLIWILMSVVSV